MNEKLTIAEKLLLAALKVREGSKTFSAEDLVVEAWKMFPDSFGLAGYADKYPDSNRILTNIMGTKGMRGKGWLRKVGEKRYQVTSKALSDGADLIVRSEELPGKAGYLRAELDRKASVALERLLVTNASQKILGEMAGELTFNDACGFWDITVRSNANTLNVRLNEVTVLLDQAKKLIENRDDSEGLKLSQDTITRKEIGDLIQAHSEMQETFKAELNVIKRRTDERGRRSKRL